MGRRKHETGNVATLDPPQGDLPPQGADEKADLGLTPPDLQNDHAADTLHGGHAEWDALEQRQAARVAPIEKPPVTSPGLIGWPVWYVNHAGVTLPARLQCRMRNDPNLWEVRVANQGANIEVSRVNVSYSSELKIGCWTFIPGLKPRMQ